MSHITKLELKITDVELFEQVATAAGWQSLGTKEHSMYNGQTCTGRGFQLPGWRYPVVVTEGVIEYDNYGGHWGEQATLETVTQRYAVEVAKRALKRQGHRVRERTLSSGEVQLIVQQ